MAETAKNILAKTTTEFIGIPIVVNANIALLPYMSMTYPRYLEIGPGASIDVPANSIVEVD
jgi:hypothetical protein